MYSPPHKNPRQRKRVVVTRANLGSAGPARLYWAQWERVLGFVAHITVTRAHHHAITIDHPFA